MTSTETDTDQPVAEAVKEMLTALGKQEQAAEEYLADKIAKFQEFIAKYGAEHAMKFAAEDISAAEWELGMKRRMTRCYDRTSSETQMWQSVREQALQQLCDTSTTGNLFAAADVGARRHAAARWLRNADEMLEKIDLAS